MDASSAPRIGANHEGCLAVHESCLAVHQGLTAVHEGRPPIHEGSPATSTAWLGVAVSPSFVDLRSSTASLDEVVAHVAHEGAGAICVFVGAVRRENEGRAIVRLEYEAYAPMALAEMKRIVDEIVHEIPGVRLAVVHRTGSLAVGESAVLCAASAAHRDEAYRASRALIDRIKARVPIWKREHGPDGAYWVGWQDARPRPSDG